MRHPAAGTGTARVSYAELHNYAFFSFLDGVSSPEALVEEAVRLGLDAVVLTDHDGMSGAVRFAEAAAISGSAPATAPSSRSSSRPRRAASRIRSAPICWPWPATSPGISGCAG